MVNNSVNTEVNEIKNEKFERELKPFLEANVPALASRILYLVRNPSLGKQPYLDPVFGDFYSNCLGTSLWVHGLTKLERPGFVDGHTFGKFLSNPELFEEGNRIFPTPGEIFFFYKSSKEDYHSGIWLGRDNNKDFFFHQDGYGGKEKKGKFSLVADNLSKYVFQLGYNLQFYSPVKGKEDEISREIIRANLESEGLTKKVLEESLKSDIEAETLLRVGLDDSLMEITKQSYALYCDNRKAVGREPVSFEEFFVRFMRANKAQELGAITRGAMRTFVLDEIENDVLKTIVD